MGGVKISTSKTPLRATFAGKSTNIQSYSRRYGPGDDGICGNEQIYMVIDGKNFIGLKR